MWNNKKFLADIKPDFKKLGEYGFIKGQDGYIFNKDIADGVFSFNIYVRADGACQLEIIDKETAEEYVMAYAEDSVGAFVGGVRAECEKILADVTRNCFTQSVFKSIDAQSVIDYIGEKYGRKPEYLWEKFPDNAIFRANEGGKWFATILTVEKSKLGIEGGGNVEVIDLKDTPENIDRLIDGNRYFHGYHMNKKHWYTICLDGRTPIEEICKRIDVSFDLTAQKGK